MADMESLAKAHGLTYKSVTWGWHVLQRMSIWRFADEPVDKIGYWIVFVHGGAWRDPSITADSFWPAVKHMATSGDFKSEVRGFVSIDYRLARHPDHPQSPNTPKTELNDAKHPDQVRDLVNALAYVYDNYGLDKYIIIGHSAGGTMAFQKLMGGQGMGRGVWRKINEPVAVVSISGIYDLIRLNERFGGQYAGFIGGNFGSRDHWEEASPTRFRCSYKREWPGGICAVLAWSPEDTLIDEPEIDLMAAKLRGDGVDVQVVKDLRGEHDFVWQDGSQIPPLVKMALAKCPSAAFDETIKNAFSS